MKLTQLKSSLIQHRYKIIYAIILVFFYLFYSVALLGVCIFLCAHMIFRHIHNLREELKSYELTLKDGAEMPKQRKEWDLDWVLYVAMFLFFMSVQVIMLFKKYDVNY